MNKLFLIFFSIILISTISFAEMKLKLSADLTGETTQTLVNNNLESKLNLSLPSEVVAPNMMELAKGAMLLGVLADVSFPMGSDDGFKHVAGTAWSGHVEFSYFVSPVFRIMVRAGYINFGTQTEEGSDFGYSYKYEDTFSQIPILVGAYYMIPTGSGFKPYVGLAIGVFFQTYKVNWYEDFGGLLQPFTLDDSFSNTGFGVVPGIGAYYMAGSVLIQLGVEYTYVFSDGPTVDYSYDYYPYSSLNKVAGVTQDETDSESSDKPSYFSVVAGVSFPLGH
jgi:outer membrane protein W